MCIKIYYSIDFSNKLWHIYMTGIFTVISWDFILVKKVLKVIISLYLKELDSSLNNENQLNWNVEKSLKKLN